MTRTGSEWESDPQKARVKKCQHTEVSDPSGQRAGCRKMEAYSSPPRCKKIKPSGLQRRTRTGKQNRRREQTRKPMSISHSVSPRVWREGAGSMTVYVQGHECPWHTQKERVIGMSAWSLVFDLVFVTGSKGKNKNKLVDALSRGWGRMRR